MSDNNTSAIKVVFWGIFLIILSIVVMCYAPLFKERLQTIAATGLATEKKAEEQVDSDVFSEYEVKGNDIIINSYLDGVVFDSSDNYMVKILKDDMGYILTTVEQNGTPPKEYYFVGKGWFNMTTSPTVSEPTIEAETTITDFDPDIEIDNPVDKKYQDNITVTSP